MNNIFKKCEMFYFLEVDFFYRTMIIARSVQFQSFVFEVETGAVGMLFRPFIESCRQIVRHVIFPVANLTFAYELHTLFAITIKIQIRFNVDGRIVLHAIEIQMIAHL